MTTMKGVVLTLLFAAAFCWRGPVIVKHFKDGCEEVAENVIAEVSTSDNACTQLFSQLTEAERISDCPTPDVASDADCAEVVDEILARPEVLACTCSLSPQVNASQVGEATEGSAALNPTMFDLLSDALDTACPDQVNLIRQAAVVYDVTLNCAADPEVVEAVDAQPVAAAPGQAAEEQPAVTDDAREPRDSQTFVINWTFGPWADLEVCVGDGVRFIWTGYQHGLFQIPSSDCPEDFDEDPENMMNPLADVTSQGSILIPIVGPGEFYVADPEADHCQLFGRIRIVAREC